MHAFDRLTDRQRDRQTDRILIVRPRLHSMQRGKKLSSDLHENFTRDVWIRMFPSNFGNHQDSVSGPDRMRLVGRLRSPNYLVIIIIIIIIIINFDPRYQYPGEFNNKNYAMRNYAIVVVVVKTFKLDTVTTVTEALFKIYIKMLH